MPGPHKIWLANPVLSRTIVSTGAYYQTKSTLTKAEIEIATNVINGHWCAAYGNYEHEKIGVEKGGLAPEKVEALIAGLHDIVRRSSAAGRVRARVHLGCGARRAARPLLPCAGPSSS